MYFKHLIIGSTCLPSHEYSSFPRYQLLFHNPIDKILAGERILQSVNEYNGLAALLPRALTL